jgi:nuclear pore complex protein Nup98-Nup96
MLSPFPSLLFLWTLLTFLVGLFGTGTTTSAFGQPQQNTTSVFGSTGAFGHQQPQQQSAFGTNTTTAQGGLFGAKPAGTGAFGTTGAFGGGTTTGAFGTNTVAFGNTASTATPSAFGAGINTPFLHFC